MSRSIDMGYAFMRPTSLPGNKKKALGFCFVQNLPISKKHTSMIEVTNQYLILYRFLLPGSVLVLGHCEVTDGMSQTES